VAYGADFAPNAFARFSYFQEHKSSMKALNGLGGTNDYITYMKVAAVEQITIWCPRRRFVRR
jgi:hypothetical protein